MAKITEKTKKDLATKPKAATQTIKHVIPAAVPAAEVSTTPVSEGEKMVAEEMAKLEQIKEGENQ
jgi:hypothetical protein